MNAGVRQKGGVLAGGALSVLGAWLPSVSKLPVRYTPDGEPVVTSEWIPGLVPGFQGVDSVVVVAVTVAAVAVLIDTDREVADWIVVAASLLVLLVGTRSTLRYLAVDRYALDTGAYLAVIGGAVMLIGSVVRPLERVRRRLNGGRGGGRPRSTRSAGVRTTAGGQRASAQTHVDGHVRAVGTSVTFRTKGTNIKRAAPRTGVWTSSSPRTARRGARRRWSTRWRWPGRRRGR